MRHSSISKLNLALVFNLPLSLLAILVLWFILVLNLIFYVKQLKRDKMLKECQAAKENFIQLLKRLNQTSN